MCPGCNWFWTEASVDAFAHYKIVSVETGVFVSVFERAKSELKKTKKQQTPKQTE